MNFLGDVRDRTFKLILGVVRYDGNDHHVDAGPILGDVEGSGKGSGDGGTHSGDGGGVVAVAVPSDKRSRKKKPRKVGRPKLSRSLFGGVVQPRRDKSGIIGAKRGLNADVAVDIAPDQPIATAGTSSGDASGGASIRKEKKGKKEKKKQDENVPSDNGLDDEGSIEELEAESKKLVARLKKINDKIEELKREAIATTPSL